MLVNNYQFTSQYMNNTTFKGKRIEPDFAIAQGKSKVAEIGIGVTGAAILVAALKNPFKNFGKNLLFKIKNSQPLNKHKTINIKDCRDSEEIAKSSFLKNFVEGIKQPFIETSDGQKKLRYIPNGLMLTGPDSKAKGDRFNWMLDEMKKAGAEIIDPGEGKKAKFDKVNDAWWKMWENNNDEEFKKTGKYRVFVVRGVDELGQPSGLKEGYYKFPDGHILKDSPDSNESRSRHGIMLFYTCKNPERLDPATIREGRIDVKTSVRPYDDESLDTWKDYLKDMKWETPSVVVKKLDEAKQVLSRRGKNALDEMHVHLQYSIPYVTPKPNDSLEKWNDYIHKTSQDVDRKKCNTYLLEAVATAREGLENTVEGNEKFEKIVKMTEDIQRPEDLRHWQNSLKFELAGENVAYSTGSSETGSERIARIRAQEGREVGSITQGKYDIAKEIKQGDDV